MIEIPLVFEGKNNNVFPLCDACNFFSEKFNRHISWSLQTFQPSLKIISPAQIDDVEWFIYPVILHDPWFHIRAIQGFHHEDYGFWSYVSNEVINALKQKKGWILIDATWGMSSPYSKVRLARMGWTKQDLKAVKGYFVHLKNSR